MSRNSSNRFQMMLAIIITIATILLGLKLYNQSQVIRSEKVDINQNSLAAPISSETVDSTSNQKEISPTKEESGSSTKDGVVSITLPNFKESDPIFTESFKLGNAGAIKSLPPKFETITSIDGLYGYALGRAKSVSIESSNGTNVFPLEISKEDSSPQISAKTISDIIKRSSKSFNGSENIRVIDYGNNTLFSARNENGSVQLELPAQIAIEIDRSIMSEIIPTPEGHEAAQLQREWGFSRDQKYLDFKKEWAGKRGVYVIKGAGGYVPYRLTSGEDINAGSVFDVSVPPLLRRPK